MALLQDVWLPVQNVPETIASIEHSQIMQSRWSNRTAYECSVIGPALDALCLPSASHWQSAKAKTHRTWGSPAPNLTKMGACAVCVGRCAGRTKDRALCSWLTGLRMSRIDSAEEAAASCQCRLSCRSRSLPFEANILGHS